MPHSNDHVTSRINLRFFCAALVPVPQKRAEAHRLDVRARILSFQEGGKPVREAAMNTLLEMHQKGDLKCGLDGSMFYGFLSTASAPPYQRCRRDRDGESFWVRGGRNGMRQKYSERAVTACLEAGFAVVLEEDVTERSVFATAADSALARGITKLGYVGGRTGRFMGEVTNEFARCWAEGHVGEDMLTRHHLGGEGHAAWTIDNLEVRISGRTLDS